MLYTGRLTFSARVRRLADIERWQPHQEATLRQIVQDMWHAAGEGDRHAVWELETRFHQYLWQVADHGMLLEVVSCLRSRISRFLYEATVSLPRGELETHFAVHSNDIIDHLKGGDVAAAKQMMMHNIPGRLSRRTVDRDHRHRSGDMVRYKVVITDFTDPPFDIEEAELHSSGLDIDLVCPNTRSADEIVRHTTDADAIIVQFAQITRDVIQHMERCRVISRYGIGVDMIDIPAATERGIWVCNVLDFCVDEVSSHTLAFLLCLNRRIHIQDRMVHAGKWVFTPGGPPDRLVGQVLGVVGLGKIGRAVAHKAKAFGLCVMAHDPYIDPHQAAQLGVQLAGLEDLLRRSDYVSVHCPLTADTRHLIGETQLRLMKPSAYLINMARGPIVDQRALHQALTQHVIAGAALDVLEQEPPTADEPLLKLDNVILTPHSSSASVEAITQLRRDTARNVVIMLQGGYPPSILNRRELNLPDTQR